MKKVILIAFLLMYNLAFSQTASHVSSPSTQGMHTDDWLNLVPNSQATAANSWNVFHKDGGSIFQIPFGTAQPTIQIGAGRPTNLGVNGQISASSRISIPIGTSLGSLLVDDAFDHDQKTIGNYSLGWYYDSWQSLAPSGYLSAFGGLKVFTAAKPRVVVTYTGNVGMAPKGFLAQLGDLMLAQERALNVFPV